MCPPAVGALANHQVARRHGRGVAQIRQAAPSEVAGEGEAVFPSAVQQLQRHDRRAENVPGIGEAELDLGVDRDGLVVLYRNAALHGVRGILPGVQWPMPRLGRPPAADRRRQRGVSLSWMRAESASMTEIRVMPSRACSKWAL